MRKRKQVAEAIALIAFAALACACASGRVRLPTLPAVGAANAAALSARGEYVARDVSVCGQCHAADAKRDIDGPLSGGREFRNWRIGTVRAANLTPDPATGLGAWSAAEIVRALRNGERKDGRLLAPIMPYEWYHRMSDDDALAVAVYLQGQPAVRNEVRQSPNLLFRMARGLLLRPKPEITAAAPPRGATAEYGGYLAQHVGLCADCHTPRKGLRSLPDRSRLFAGMKDPPKEFPSNPWNLTPDEETGIGRWSEDDFLRTMRTGVNPSGISLHPFMPWQQTRRMSDDDLRAIYRFLRTLPPIRNEVPRRPWPRPLRQP